MKKRKRFVPAMVLPMYIWSALLVGLPLCYVLVLSFLKTDQVHGFLWEFTFDQYARLADPVYASVLWRSLRLAASTTALTFLIGYPFAYCLAKLSGRVRQIVFLLVVIPFWTNSLLRTSGIITLLAGNGPVNSFLQAMGWTQEPVSFLYTYPVTLIGMVYSLLPFMILPCYSSCEKLDKSLKEASRDLGAGRVRTFFSVSLPLTLPGILSGVILVFVPSVGMYFITDLLGGANVLMIGNLIDQQIHGIRNLPFAAALSVVMMLMALVFIAVYRLFSGKSELEI